MRKKFHFTLCASLIFFFAVKVNAQPNLVPPEIKCPSGLSATTPVNECFVNVTVPTITVTGSPTPVVSYEYTGDVFVQEISTNPLVLRSGVGRTTVTVRAISIAGRATCTFDITVLDGTPPPVCPSNITISATSSSGAVVNYGLIGPLNCGGKIGLPVTNSIFPIGTTTVNVYNNVSAQETIYALKGNQLFKINVGNGSIIGGPISITGLATTEYESERIVSIDFRQSTGQLYGLGVVQCNLSTLNLCSRLYTINTTTGVATQVGTGSFSLITRDHEIEFDPVTDVIRIIGGTYQTNYLIDPNTGVTTFDSFREGQPGFKAIAYSNNHSSSTFTTLYALTTENILYTIGGINGIPPPNMSSVFAVGPLNPDPLPSPVIISSEQSGFDISQRGLAWIVSEGNVFSSINLINGRASKLGIFGLANIEDFSVEPFSLPSVSCSFTVTVTPPPPSVTINQATGQSDPTTVGPINFTVVFSEPVTGFTSADVTLSGSAGATTAGITEIAPNNGTTFNVAVSGMTTAGTVIATIPADAVLNSSNIGNTASSSTDNTITYIAPTAPTVTINKAATQPDPTINVPVRFTVVFDQDVAGFDASDISFAGSTVPGTLGATVTGSGAIYQVSVSGITGAGNVVASVLAGAAVNNDELQSLASTSTDNIVQVLVVANDFFITKTAQFPTTVAGGLITYFVTIARATSPPGPPLQNVNVTDILPVGTRFFNLQPLSFNTTFPIISVPPSGQNGTVNLLFPIFSTSQFFTFRLIVGVDAGTTGSISNTATVGGPLGDINPTNNSATAVVQILVPPTITCPDNITISTRSADCIGIVDLGDLPFTMTGTPAPTLRLSFRHGDNPLAMLNDLSITPGTSLPTAFVKGTTTVTATASNGVDPDATCQFTVTVVDQTPPSITCPQNISIKADANVCYANLSNAAIGNATATDNCGGTIAITHTNYPAGNNFLVGTTNIIWTATDGSGNTATCLQTITVGDDQPPVITNASPNPYILWPPNHKMKDVEVRYSSSDNCGVASCRLEVSSNEPINGTGDGDTSPDWEIVDDHHVKLRAERAGNGDGRIYTITIICGDEQGNETRETVTVRVAHNITAPHSGQSFKVGSTVAFAGTFWDKPGNKHTAKWLIDGTSVNGVVTEPVGSKNGKVTASYKFNTPGVYKLQMNVTDQYGVTSYANTNGDLEAIVVIYDPNGGYTYGGGWYESPASALISNPSSTGKASYGFTMNYFKSATNPKGETQFEFKVGEFEFNALNFDYLVISNSMAQFKGTGKIIGGQSGIGFTMTVVDGQLDGTGIDKIRMKIYNKNNGKIIYDNQPGASDASLPDQAVGENSLIVIQNNFSNNNLTTKTTSHEVESEIKPVNEFDVTVYPNPASSYFNILINSNDAKEKILMQVFDQYGRSIETKNVLNGSAARLGDKYRPGVYYVRVLQGKQHKEIKLVKLSD